ncbi:MAG: replication-associated recombination protein A [Cystobacterineae bacterium]|nr:replication-associated recombination protein A [Cystobacterineae bacterium]
MDLFEQAAGQDSHLRAPLAERMRPRNLDEFLGQTHLVGPGKLIRRAIETGNLPSLVFWGPPGSGKTPLARLIAHATRGAFEPISAVNAGVRELRETVTKAQERWRFHRQLTLLFVDEIHRFNKAQQDALLPYVENGTLILLGATTENPSFEINAALLSRLRVVSLYALDEEQLRHLLSQALENERGFGGKLQVDEDALTLIAQNAYGDARQALTMLEMCAFHAKNNVTLKTVEEAMQQNSFLYDKHGEEHYNVVSAFIKSMRGSDPDAAVYWMARMLESGEEPRFVARRMVIFASEDVGNAEPRGLLVAVAAMQAVEMLGMPEGRLPLTQAVTFLAMAPKSNTAISTYHLAKDSIQRYGPLPVPLHLRNAPTQLMKSMGYAAGYQYPHNFSGHYVVENYLPEGLRAERFFFPSGNGEELAVQTRYAQLQKLKQPKEPGENG